MTDTTLQGAEIFATGTWNGMAFSDADVEAIAASFNALNLSGRVPLKLGHDGADARRGDGEPSLGWIERVQAVGGKLLADIKLTSAKLAEGIKSGAYKFVSVELLQDVRAGNRVIPFVLDAVAVLGSTQPAVGTLKDLASSLRPMARGMPALQFASRVTFTRSPAADAAEALRAENAALRAQMHRQSIDNALHMAQVSGSLSPAGRARFEQLFGLKTDADYSRVTLSQFSQFVAGETPLRMSSRPTSRVVPSGQGGPHDVEPERADEALALRVRDLMTARERAGRPLTFSQATRHVLTVDPDLAARYRDIESWSHLPMNRTIHL
jgi:hypothetical protein